MARAALFLPEASDYIGSSPDETKSLATPALQSPFVQGLMESAKQHSLPISVGIHEPSDNPTSSRIKNTLIWISAQGELVHRYQKLHLFDLEIDNGPKMRESDVIEPGNSIEPPYPSPVGKVGSCICFDLRFPEIALSLKRQGADVIVYLSAFTPETGKVGQHNEKRKSYGHSIAIDPWGEVVAELGGEQKDGPEVCFVDVDLEKVKKTREMVPLKRRTDVYPEV
ncbi:putative nitrilase [Hortaea werneckii]|nr:putative nitrilase [Hortaea werneckii]KAI7593494.1 putative nitrilase [Hortaea werneckii]